jgi:hypothetical protein
MKKGHGAMTVMATAFAMTLAACGGESGEPPGEVEEARFEGAAVESGEVPGAQLARARQTADDLTRELAPLVMSTMQEQGAVAAIEVCSGVAQERTAAHAAEGVRVRRVSNRVRNPANAPDEAEARELERLEALSRDGVMPAEVVRLVRTGDTRTLHYLRPIATAAPCLACHGAEEEIDPGVRSILRERYPSDAATGYRVGDLRGAVSVRVDLQ